MQSMQENFPYRFRQALGLRAQRACREGECRTDEECGEGCGCFRDPEGGESTRCGPLDPGPECAADECRTDEECGEGCGCVLESFPMRCGPVDPEPEVCAGECRTDADCGELCSCAEDRGVIQFKKICLEFWLENPLEFSLEILYSKKKLKDGWVRHVAESKWNINPTFQPKTGTKQNSN